MNLTWLEFAVASLATFRLSLLVTNEDGPAKLFARLRRIPKAKSSTHEWLTCLWCFSVTASALVCLCLWYTGVRQHWGDWLLTWWALSAAAIGLNQTLTKGTL